jgi:hypothetical protein
MKDILNWSFLLAIGCWVLGACNVSSQPPNAEYEYGRKINYSDHETKKLPDFSIRFLKERHQESSVFPRGFTFYDFEVTKAEEKKTISWSSGTGDIGPTFFDLAGEKYVFELKASKAYDGFVKDGEMVLWRRNDYDNLKNR